MAIDKLTAVRHLRDHFKIPMDEALDLVSVHPRELRDEFAMAALPVAEGPPKHMAREAYEIADAMLEARNANR